jgi:GT2 family glycosyltransferase
MVGPELSVIIISWNTRDLLRDCLASIAKDLTGLSHEVIVVDNDSSDDSAAMVASEFPDVRLLRNDKNAGFGAANNQAMRIARGDWFLLLNSDTYLTDDSVARLVDRVKALADVGVAQCRLYFTDGRLQYTTHRFPSMALTLFEALGVYKLVPSRAPDVLLRGYWDHDSERDVDWVIGAFMLVRREVFEETGGFDERIHMYGEDREWCYRIRQVGWRIRFYPQASIVHVGHASSDIGLGNKRLALCLRRDRDFYVEQHGRTRATIMMSMLVVGAVLRVAYYAVRVRMGGERAEAYRLMQPEVSATLRIQLALILGRQ